MEDRAESFARYHHDLVGQVRKYTEEPYINHPERVVSLVKSVDHDSNMICAAWLHDTIEDTNATIEEIYIIFGNQVGDMVDTLTKKNYPGFTRSEKNSFDREFLLLGSEEAKTIKLADIIDNCSDLVKHDPKFAKKYFKEKLKTLEVLKSGNQELWKRAYDILTNTKD